LLANVFARYPELRAGLPVIKTRSPNSPETRVLMESVRPDLMIARHKVLLTLEIFEVTTIGTFLMHPGICPEYRNAHGCFWELANGGLDKLGVDCPKSMKASIPIHFTDLLAIRMTSAANHKSPFNSAQLLKT